MASNPYRILGLSLCTAGTLFALISYFIINSIPLIAIGISGILIGAICIGLSYTQPPVSPQAAQLILKTGMENTAALLEELGLTNRAVYLPSSMREGHPQALIPLMKKKEIKLAKKKIPGRLIIRYGANPDDMAIAVTTPGSINIDVLETKPGPTAGEIEAAVTYILAGVLDIARSVFVTLSDNTIHAEVSGAKLHYEDIWYYRCLGSPIASIVAAVSSEALGKPVRIKEERVDKGTSQIILEVLP